MPNILLSEVVSTGITFQDLAVFAGLITAALTIGKVAASFLLRYIQDKIIKNDSRKQSDQCRFDHEHLNGSVEKILGHIGEIERNSRLKNRLILKYLRAISKNTINTKNE